MFDDGTPKAELVTEAHEYRRLAVPRIAAEKHDVQLTSQNLREQHGVEPSGHIGVLGEVIVQPSVAAIAGGAPAVEPANGADRVVDDLGELPRRLRPVWRPRPGRAHQGEERLGARRTAGGIELDSREQRLEK